MPKQITDVGADAEIVEFPGIDADSHAEMISGERGVPAAGRGPVTADPHPISTVFGHEIAKSTKPVGIPV
jgi:hypothetical protein